MRVLCWVEFIRPINPAKHGVGQGVLVVSDNYRWSNEFDPTELIVRPGKEFFYYW